MDGLASVPHLLLQLAGIVAIVLGFLVPILAVVWWLNRRDRRRREVQEQLREMEQAIWRGEPAGLAARGDSGGPPAPGRDRPRGPAAARLAGGGAMNARSMTLMLTYLLIAIPVTVRVGGPSGWSAGTGGMPGCQRRGGCSGKRSGGVSSSSSS